ncbi:MAG: triose-phosphate isomerase [Deltaproteobacteria bacterium]|nr:MAG: triose-phosphate isomerase [Deltaproteobacteria bacterium]
MKPLVVGNWKMHGTQHEAVALAREVLKGLRGRRRVDVVLAPPFTALGPVRKTLRGSALRLAGQNVHWEEQGAFTGEISAKMLRELGCHFAIVGHSERRRLFNETDQTVAKKLAACLRSGLRPILCVGETLEQRNAGATRRVITRQLRIALKGMTKDAIEKIEIAYEPVWAIGTGRNATPEQASRAHATIRRMLKKLFGTKRAEQTRILYGGSVRADNAGELACAREVNGLLVGGASLKAKDFLSIIGNFS